jgi:hypothetical protein
LERSVSLDPTWDEPRIQLGCLLSQLGDWRGVHDVVGDVASVDRLHGLAEWRACTLLALAVAGRLAVDPVGAVPTLRASIGYLDQLGDAFRECPPPHEVLAVLTGPLTVDLVPRSTRTHVRELLDRYAAHPPYGTDEDLLRTATERWRTA